MPIERRVPGQSATLPASVVTDGTVYTSGLVSAQALAAAPDGTVTPAPDQIDEVVATLQKVLVESGSSAANVVRIDAYLASAADLPQWNEAFLKLWPEPGPARTTLIVGFANPRVLFELNAIAVLDA